MKLRLIRYSDNGKSTLGLLFVDGVFFNYCLEDEYREKKIKGKTRIPHGTYTVEKYKVLTPKTKAYRAKHNWFDYHYMLLDVPNFKNIYIHKGNEERHTDGCLIVAHTSNNNQIGPGFVGNSTKAFERLYSKLNGADGKIEITIVDMDRELKA